MVSSDLLETELRRMAVRERLDQHDVTRLLDGVALAALDRAVYRSAGLLPIPYLRTLDALHLEAAIRLNAAAILTYDRRLSEAARSVGIEVIAPVALPAPRDGARRWVIVRRHSLASALPGRAERS